MVQWLRLCASNAGGLVSILVMELDLTGLNWRSRMLQWRPGEVSESCSVVSHSLRPHTSPRNSPGQNTGVGSLSLLQGIFPTQGLNLSLLHWGRILYQLRHQGSPRILEWVAYPFPSGSSRPRSWTGVSCITGRFFTNWGIREALISGKTVSGKTWCRQINKHFKKWTN